MPRYKTEDVYVQGKVKWFRFIKPDVKYPPPRWSHIMYPNPEGMEIVRGLVERGLKNKIKRDEDGDYITWTRYTFIDAKAGPIPLAAPEVFIRKEGIVVPFYEEVGHGSDVTTKLEVREYKVPHSTEKGLAARWTSSLIDHLIPYDGGRDLTELEAAAARGLDKQKQQF